MPGNIRGLAVHEAARILALAAAGEVLVLSTTRELASGPNLDYEDRGRTSSRACPRNAGSLRLDAGGD